MAIYAIHHRKPAPGMPTNTSTNYCGCCWAAPGREHGLACPAVELHPDTFRFFRGLLNGLALGALAWLPIVAVAAFFLIRSN